MESLIQSEVISAIVYATLGICVFFLVILIVDILTKNSLNREIIEEHNSALAIVIASIVISLGMIIASAIH